MANRPAGLVCAKAGAASGRLVGGGLGHASAGRQLLRCSGREAGLDDTAALERDCWPAVHAGQDVPTGESSLCGQGPEAPVSWLGAHCLSVCNIVLPPEPPQRLHLTSSHCLCGSL